jgi:hypothetical protein
MKRIRISPLAVAGLLMLIGLNAACAFWMVRILGGDTLIEIAAAAWTPDANASLTDLTATATSPNAYPESLARPIFFRDRRPYVPPPPAPVEVQAAPVIVPPPVIEPDLVVSGIALVGNAKQAYLGSPSNPNGMWVKEGEDVMGWQVSGITNAGVTISRAGKSFDLWLYAPVAQE